VVVVIVMFVVMVVVVCILSIEMLTESRTWYRIGVCDRELSQCFVRRGFESSSS